MSTDDFIDSVIAWAYKCHSDIPNYKKEIKKRKKEIVIEHVKVLDKELGVKQKERYKEAFKKAVDAFYADHDPTEYNREGDPAKQEGGMYALFNDDVGFDESGYVSGSVAMNGVIKRPFASSLLVPSNMTGTRSDDDPYYIFNLTFMEGYHGGAKSIDSSKAKIWGAHPARGTPYWRSWGMVTYPDGTRKRHRFGRWQKPATRMDSPPFKLFNEYLDQADIDIVKIDKPPILAKHKTEIKSEIKKEKEALKVKYFWPSWINEL